jgi:hypothetical protein
MHGSGLRRTKTGYVFSRSDTVCAYCIFIVVFILGGIIQHHCTDKVIDHAVIIEGFDMSGKVYVHFIPVFYLHAKIILN